MNYYVNNNDLGVAFRDFDIGNDGIVPAMHINGSKSMIVVYKESEFKYKPPDGYKPFELQGPNIKHIIEYKNNYKHETDFDTNCIFYAIGTLFDQQENEFDNPAEFDVVKVTAHAPFTDTSMASIEEMIGRNNVRCQTPVGKPCYVTIDLGVYGVKLSKYTLKHWNYSASDHLKTWDLQGSNNGYNWITIKSHKDSTELYGKSKTNTWEIDDKKECPNNTYFSYFRIFSSSQTKITLSGVELYGDLAVTSFKTKEELEESLNKIRAEYIAYKKKKTEQQLARWYGPVKKVRPLPELGSCVCDGKHIFLHCEYGLLKIGTGKFGTIKGKIYVHNDKFFNGEHSSLLIIKRPKFRLLFRCKKIDPHSFVDINPITLQSEGFMDYEDGYYFQVNNNNNNESKNDEPTSDPNLIQSIMSSFTETEIEGKDQKKSTMKSEYMRKEQIALEKLKIEQDKKDKIKKAKQKKRLEKLKIIQDRLAKKKREREQETGEEQTINISDINELNNEYKKLQIIDNKKFEYIKNELKSDDGDAKDDINVVNIDKVFKIGQLDDDTFDKDGLIYTLGTKLGEYKMWQNPFNLRILDIKTSKYGWDNEEDNLEHVISRYKTPVYSKSDREGPYFIVDFRDLKIKATGYGIGKHQHATYEMKRWKFEGSNDGKLWETIDEKRDRYEFQSGSKNTVTYNLDIFRKLTNDDPITKGLYMLNNNNHNLLYFENNKALMFPIRNKLLKKNDNDLQFMKSWVEGLWNISYTQHYYGCLYLKGDKAYFNFVRQDLFPDKPIKKDESKDDDVKIDINVKYKPDTEVQVYFKPKKMWVNGKVKSIKGTKIYVKPDNKNDIKPEVKDDEKNDRFIPVKKMY